MAVMAITCDSYLFYSHHSASLKAVMPSELFERWDDFLKLVFTVSCALLSPIMSFLL